MSDQYGISGMSAIVLIGLDGKVIARNLSSDGIQNAVTEALGAE